MTDVVTATGTVNPELNIILGTYVSGVIKGQALRFTPSDNAGGSRPRRTTAPSGDLQSHVWVLRAGKPVAIPVVAGLDDGSFVEIVGGALEVGDQVIVAERSTAGRARPRPRL